MKTSIRLIGLCFVLVTFSGFAFAQKCKFSYDKTDPITGVATKTTTKFVLDNRNPVSCITLNKTGGKYTLNLVVAFPVLKDDHMEKGDSISFKLQNGNVVTLHTNTRYNPEYDQLLGTIFRPQYDISIEELRLLAESPITYLRINAKELIYQREIKDKKGQSLQHDANCILQ